MKEFEPSTDFVARVMKNVHAYERSQERSPSFFERLLSSRPLRHALAGGGVLMGIFFIPASCI